MTQQPEGRPAYFMEKLTSRIFDFGLLLVLQVFRVDVVESETLQMRSVVSTVNTENISTFWDFYILEISSLSSSRHFKASFRVEFKPITPAASPCDNFSNVISRLENELLDRAFVAELLYTFPLSIPILVEKLDSINEFVVVMMNANPSDARKLESSKLPLQLLVLVPMETPAVSDLSCCLHLLVPVFHFELWCFFLSLLSVKAELGITLFANGVELQNLLSDSLSTSYDNVQMFRFYVDQAE